MILRALLDEEDNPELRRAVIHLLNSSGDATLRVSHLAVGEVFSGLAEDFEDDRSGAMVEFQRWIRKGKVTLQGIKDPRTVHRLALRLHGADRSLEPNDAVILAIALQDRESQVFYTQDRRLFHAAIMDIAEREFGTRIRKILEPRTRRAPENGPRRR
jgi:predicted nucleic acid-binding protein